MENIILEIKKQFFIQVETKNSWGKNELKDLYLNIVVDILALEYKKAGDEREKQMRIHWNQRHNNSKFPRTSTPEELGVYEKLDRRGRDIDPLPNSAHGFTEGAELPPDILHVNPLDENGGDKN